MALYFILFFIGLITGSFLNVVIWRYPIMCKQQLAEFQGDIDSSQPKISLARPRSHCPYCRQTLRVYDIIPLFSWLILKGYCRNCHEKIGLRYPLTELLTAFSFLLAWFVWPANIWSVAVMILSALLIAASFIDIEHQWLPDVFTQGILWTGLITESTFPRKTNVLPMTVREMLAKDPQEVFNFIQFTPVRKAGVVGYTVKPGVDRALFDASGFKEGDIAVALNQQDLKTPDALNKLRQQVYSMTSMQITILRNGSYEDISISLH